MSDKKSPIYYSSRFWAYTYAVVLFLLLTIQAVLGLLASANFTLPVVLQQYVNGKLQLPLAVATWLWTAIISLYCGLDRVVDIKNTQNLAAGSMNLGDLSKLRKIIVVCLLLFLYALGWSFILDMDFQLEALLSAFGSTVIMYTSGNKLVKASKYEGDADNDGIPDIVQEDYHTWARAQKKLGTEDAFITLDYFFDEFPDLKDKVRIEKNTHK